MALRVYPLSLLRGKPFPPRAGLRLAILQGASLVSRLEDRGETGQWRDGKEAVAGQRGGDRRPRGSWVVGER